MFRSLAVMLAVILVGCDAGKQAALPDNVQSRRIRPFLNMPQTPGGVMPQRLSQVGAFQDAGASRPVAGLIPYDINVSFWSDGAAKERWMGLPAGKQIAFSPEGEWKFPPGTVFVKTFEFPKDQVPAGRAHARIETRVLVRDAQGGVFGASYRWRADGSDADRVTEPTTASIAGPGASAGEIRNWYFPGPDDCVVCHTKPAGGVLGVKTRQVNRPLRDAGENQLVTWERLGLFQPGHAKIDPKLLPRLASATDASRTIEDRARSFLDANCANCHRPGGVAGNFDARYETPLARQNLVGGPVLIDLGFDRARVIAPRDPWRSIALARVETSDQTRMPPLAHEKVDAQGAKLLRSWIGSLPGEKVLEPVTIQPRGGEFKGEVRVVVRHPDPQAVIRYTLDGGAPGTSSPVYNRPIVLTGPTTLRARAYKPGEMRSVIVQETFIVND